MPGARAALSTIRGLDFLMERAVVIKEESGGSALSSSNPMLGNLCLSHGVSLRSRAYDFCLVARINCLQAATTSWLEKTGMPFDQH